MRRVLAVLSAISALAMFPLNADESIADEDSAEVHEAYVLHQGGDWPTSWPKELDPLRNHAGPGRFTATFWRPGEDVVHFGIRFTTREEFEAAWPHLLKVQSKGAPIILRSGRSFWLGGTSHGVCVHQKPAIWRVSGRNLPIKSNTPVAARKPLSVLELKEKTTNSIELFVDGNIVDLNRVSLPTESRIIDKRLKETGKRENGDPLSIAPRAVDAREKLVTE